MCSENSNLILATRTKISPVACLPTFPNPMLTASLPYYFISSLIDLSHVLPIFLASIPKPSACLLSLSIQSFAQCITKHFEAKEPDVVN
jgi:hypothetical protein